MQIEVIGVPLDLGAGRRGVDMGPSAIRLAGLRSAIEALGWQITDGGDIAIVAPEVQKIVDPKLKYLPAIAKACRQLAKAVQAIVERGNMPLVLGGDHSIAVGTVGGVAAHFRNQNKKLGLIWIDAHGDLNTPETSPSGNIHGMPLAVCLGMGAPELTKIGGDFAKVSPQNVVIVGARSLDPMEQEVIRDAGIAVYTMVDIDRRGIYDVMLEAVEQATSYTDGLHVSLDLDVLDPQIAPGVGTPVRGGLNYREAHTAMEIVARSGHLVSLEVVEVNPILDIRNATAEMAVELVQSALGKRIL